MTKMVAMLIVISISMSVKPEPARKLLDNENGLDGGHCLGSGLIGILKVLFPAPIDIAASTRSSPLGIDCHGSNLRISKHADLWLSKNFYAIALAGNNRTFGLAKPGAQ